MREINARDDGIFLVCGLMCGTSHDGVDGALLDTDGRERLVVLARATRPFAPAFQQELAELVEAARNIPQGEAEAFARAHAALEERFLQQYGELVLRLAAEAGRPLAHIDAIGFHGLTLQHRPEEGWSWQWGDPARLAKMLGRPVIAGWRQDDLAAGGEGAPLVPVYHRLLVRRARLREPVAILNIGGVANVTWVDSAKEPEEGGLLAFDTGPGNGLIDAWMRMRGGAPCDRDGRHALSGRVDHAALRRLMSHPYFSRRPPKSLDKFTFSIDPCAGLETADGAATLTAFTAAAAAAAVRWFPAPAAHWWVTGGGRRNPAILRALRRRLGKAVQPIEAAGYDGDSLEAEAFAYLAARRLARLPASFPATTGVARPAVLGRIYEPNGGRRR